MLLWWLMMFRVGYCADATILHQWLGRTRLQSCRGSVRQTAVQSPPLWLLLSLSLLLLFCVCVSCFFGLGGKWKPGGFWFLISGFRLPPPAALRVINALSWGTHLLAARAGEERPKQRQGGQEARTPGGHRRVAGHFVIHIMSRGHRATRINTNHSSLFWLPLASPLSSHHIYFFAPISFNITS